MDCEDGMVVESIEIEADIGLEVQVDASEDDPWLEEEVVPVERIGRDVEGGWEERGAESIGSASATKSGFAFPLDEEEVEVEEPPPPSQPDSNLNS